MNEPPTARPKLRLVLADDHAMVLEGISRLLEPHFELAGVFGDGEALVAGALNLRPDLIVADIGMPRLNGLAACEEIRRSWPEARVIILSMYFSEAHVRRAVAVGARGFLPKTSAGVDLVQALHRVADGQMYYSGLGREPSAMDGDRSALEEGGRWALLTGRQREVLGLMVHGLSAKEIGTTLGISARTVEFHKEQMMQVLRMRSSSELVALAAREFPAEPAPDRGRPDGPRGFGNL